MRLNFIRRINYERRVNLMGQNVLERMKAIGADKKIADFRVKQQQPYEFKKLYAYKKAWEFREECGRRGLNCHVSIGGLDSIVLFLFLKSIGIDVPGVSVSVLEDKSIQKIHKALGIIRIMPFKSKTEVINEFGFPVLSKEIASKIEHLQNPTPENATVRHAIVTGETGEYGGHRKNTRMKLSKKWLEKFGGYENDNEGTNYQKPPKCIKVSAKCCDYLKEKPCDDWAKKHNSVPYLGLMASEGGRRQRSLMINGCNYFGKTTIRSAPFAIFSRQDILQLALEMDHLWKTKWKQKYEEKARAEGWLADNESLPDTIIPEIYGTIERDENGNLYTTKAQRTGCSMCGFGIQLEKRPHRFDRLREDNPKEWEFWMYQCCTDPETGEKFGWGRVLDYIGVKWEDKVVS